WLDAFAKDRFGQDHLARFGVLRDPRSDKTLSFSVTRRPAHYKSAPAMALVGHVTPATTWDDVMENIALWLARHMDNPQLIVWAARQGGHLAHRFASILRQRLDHLATLESAGEVAKIADIRAQAPSAIPRPPMRALWEIVLSGRNAIRPPHLNLYLWAE